MTNAILIEEGYWVNSQLSIARYYGGININEKSYKIVNKNGCTLFELSDPSSPHYVKEGKAIPAGEPADLVLEEWIPVYKALGRDKIIELIKKGTSLEEALEMIPKNMRPKKRKGRISKKK